MILRRIDSEIGESLLNYSGYFYFNSKHDLIQYVHDFHSTGVVSQAMGIPAHKLRASAYEILDDDEKPIILNKHQIDNMVLDIQTITQYL
jgi:hypothetical protein